MGMTEGLVSAALALGMFVAHQDEIEKFFDELVVETQRLVAASDMRSISLMLDREYLFRGRYPSEANFSSWLEESTKENSLRKVTKDVWGNKFIYSTGAGNRTFTLVSLGPDGVLNTEDDLRITGP